MNCAVSNKPSTMQGCYCEQGVQVQKQVNIDYNLSCRVVGVSVGMCGKVLIFEPGRDQQLTQ